jgi:hypothetical protein
MFLPLVPGATQGHFRLQWCVGRSVLSVRERTNAEQRTPQEPWAAADPAEAGLFIACPTRATHFSVIGGASFQSY